MRRVTCSLSTSLDGYIAGPDGSFDWGAPDEELFRFATDEVRGLSAHLLGRRLYESMVYWEPGHLDPNCNELELEFAALWQALPKVVFSSTLSAVEGENACLAAAGLADEIARLRAESGEGNIGIGGPTLAVQAAGLGLIDEYRLRVYPVLVGGGIPFFPREEQFAKLELLETRTFGSQVVFMHYRVLH